MRASKGEQLRSERELLQTIEDFVLFLRLLTTPMPGDNAWRLTMAKTVHSRAVSP